MRYLFFLYFLPILACTEIQNPTITPNEPDSCQVFWDDFERYWVHVDTIPAITGIIVQGPWAEFDAFQPATYRIQMVFYEHRNCIIGMTPEELKERLGKPLYTHETNGYESYTYGALLLPEGYSQWNRTCTIAFSNQPDTLRKVTWRSVGLMGGEGSIVIE